MSRRFVKRDEARMDEKIRVRKSFQAFGVCWHGEERLS